MATDQRLPTSDTSVQFTPTGATPNYNCVDDPIGSPDEDSTYNRSVTGLHTDVFGFSAFAVPSGSTINNITVRWRGRKEVSQASQGAPLLRVGGSNYVGTLVDPGTAYSNQFQSWVNNPATGSAWTVDQVNGVGANALQRFGYQKQNNARALRITQAYIEVDHTPATNVNVSDTGSGTDSLASLQAQIAQTETGTGSDVVPSLEARVSQSETSTGSDGPAIEGQVPCSDSGSGSDSPVGAWLMDPLLDPGAGTDGLTVEVPQDISDAGVGNEALGLEAQAAVSERGSGAESLLLEVALALGNLVAGSDALGLQALVGLIDSGGGAEVLNVQTGGGTPVSISDLAGSAEAISVEASVPVSDGGSAEELVTLQISLTLEETGATTELIIAGISLNLVNPLVESLYGLKSFTSLYKIKDIKVIYSAKDVASLETEKKIGSLYPVKSLEVE